MTKPQPMAGQAAQGLQAYARSIESRDELLNKSSESLFKNASLFEDSLRLEDIYYDNVEAQWVDENKEKTLFFHRPKGRFLVLRIVVTNSGKDEKVLPIPVILTKESWFGVSPVNLAWGGDGFASHVKVGAKETIGFQFLFDVPESEFLAATLFPEKVPSKPKDCRSVFLTPRE